MENSIPIKCEWISWFYAFKYLVCHCLNYLGKIRKCNLAGDLLMKIRFEVWKRLVSFCSLSLCTCLCVLVCLFLFLYPTCKLGCKFSAFPVIKTFFCFHRLLHSETEFPWLQYFFHIKTKIAKTLGM